VARLIRSERMSTEPLIELLERAGITIGRAEQVILARSASPEVARALHVEPGTALLESERLVFDDQDRPVEAIRVLYRPDIYRYAVDLRRTPSDSGPVWSTDALSAASPGAATPTARSPRRPRPPGRRPARGNDAT
jgi:GntR family transcriptional regulator